MKVIPVEQPGISIPDLAKLARTGTVILTRKGKPLAAVKDLSNADWECVSLANSPRFHEIIEESRRSYREQGGMSLEQLRKELGLGSRKAPRRNSKARR